jgi:IS30 family transposase
MAERRRPRFLQPMLITHQRPSAFDNRSEAGHWERDLIIGTNQGSANGTLVERQTRIVILLHLPKRDGHALHAALQARLGQLPTGSTPVDHVASGFTDGSGRRDYEVPRHAVYFRDSHSPWQRGSNENTDGLMPDYCSKATDLSAHTAEHVRAVENEPNLRAGRCSGTSHLSSFSTRC